MDISQEVFQTLMENFDKGGMVLQLVKQFRDDGNSVKYIPVKWNTAIHVSFISQKFFLPIQDLTYLPRDMNYNAILSNV